MPSTLHRASLLALTLAAGCDSVVVVQGPADVDVRVLVDAREAGVAFNDRKLLAPHGIVDLGGIDLTGPRREMVAFNWRRPPTVFPDLQPGVPPVSHEFDGEITIRLHVWIVRGEFAAVKQEAMDHVSRAREILRDERSGIRLGPTIYHDATSAGSPELLAFDCSRQAALESAAGRTVGAVNVYYVDTVDGRLNRGERCAILTGFAVISAEAGPALLMHELGHNLGLEHIDFLSSDFDPSNVMHSASDVREFLSEGQTFRMALDPESAINNIYASRPGLLTRGCPTLLYSGQEEDCPVIGCRLWADGPFEGIQP